ncbi:MAG: iron ABC transporter permease [Chloroflexota bacterium]
MVSRSPLTTIALAAMPLAFLGLFFLWPVASILVRGLAPGGTLDLSVPLQVLMRPDTLAVAWFTFWQAVVSTVLTLAIGLPGAYVLARFDFPGRRLLNSLALVPFVLPTVVVGTAFLALIGPYGALGVRLDHTIWAILAAHVFYNSAVVLRVVGGVWAQLDPRTEEAARVLGASRWRAFVGVTWPLLRPAVLSAASIVFLFTFTSFGVILILGGYGYSTIEVAVYRAAAVLLDLPAAATLALLQLGFLGLLLVVYARLQQRAALNHRLVTARVGARRPRGRTEWSFVAATLAVVLTVLGLPLAALVERSLATGNGFGLDNFGALFGESARGALFVPPIDAIRNSLVFATTATAICLPLGLMAASVIAYRRGALATAFDALLMLPLGTSAVIVGFGFLVTLGQLPVDLRTSPLLIPIAHALIALPFVVRATVPLLSAIDRRLREAAAVLGASPARAWRMVDLPIIGRALLVGGSFAFAVSLGEFGATLFIVRPDAPTMPIAIFRLLSQPGALAFGQAMAMAVVLMAVTAVAALAFDRLRTSSVAGS